MTEPEEPTALAASRPRPMLEALPTDRQTAIHARLVALFRSELGYFSGPDEGDPDWTVSLDGGIALADVAETVLGALEPSADDSWVPPALEGLSSGWGYLRPGDRRVHFYDAGFSLCGRVGWYFGAIIAEGGPITSLDCKSCTDRLAARNRRKNAS